MLTSVYDQDNFFELYQKLRRNPISLNEIVEKPTMFQLVGSLTGKKILDLGCGTGQHLLHYLQHGATFAVGIDLSAKMLQQADKYLRQAQIEQQRYRLYQLPMEQLSLCKEQQFDLITSSFAFHYVANFADLLQQITQKLAPNGQLIFSQEHPIVTCFQQGERWEKDHNKQQVAYRLNYYREEGARQRNWFKQPFTTYHRTLSSIINTLITAGFTIEQIAEPMLTDQPEWHDEFKDLQHRPVLLFIKAKKHG